jgi:hypothetical protein
MREKGEALENGKEDESAKEGKDGERPVCPYP